MACSALSMAVKSAMLTEIAHGIFGTAHDITDKAAMLADTARSMFTPSDFAKDASSNSEVAGAMLRCCYAFLSQLLRLSQLSEAALIPPANPGPSQGGDAEAYAIAEELGCPVRYPMLKLLGMVLAAAAGCLLLPTKRCCALRADCLGTQVHEGRPKGTAAGCLFLTSCHAQRAPCWGLLVCQLNMFHNSAMCC